MENKELFIQQKILYTIKNNINNNKSLAEKEKILLKEAYSTVEKDLKTLEPSEFFNVISNMIVEFLTHEVYSNIGLMKITGEIKQVTDTNIIVQNSVNQNFQLYLGDEDKEMINMRDITKGFDHIQAIAQATDQTYYEIIKLKMKPRQ